LFLSRANELNVSSPFGPVRVNTSTMTSTNHTFVNCAFSHEGFVGLVPPLTNDNGYGLALGTGVYDLVIQGGSTSRSPRGGVLHIRGEGNRRISINSVNWESKAAKAAIVIDGYVFGLSVADGLLQAEGPALQVNGTADGVRLFPAESLTTSLIQLGVGGKLKGAGLTTAGLSGSN
jgi:hypothetical protein